MAGDFRTPHKVFIRNNYNKKIIKYLKKRCRYNIIYFGLPSPEAQDIECWLDYISYVIAFQCRDYSKVSTPDLPTDEIDKLIGKLNEWEMASKIDGYDVYDGFMEEVIFNGYDNSSSGSIPFVFENAVTLFNLDFCNKITSPQEYLNADGEYEKKYKFELIDKILDYQKQVSEENQGFVLFITINSGYDGEELSDYVNANQESLSVYNRCSRSERKQFILKHFVESILYDKFYSKDFIPHILPTVFYDGIRGIKMMQFAAMCIKPSENHRRAGVFNVPQNKSEICLSYPILPDCDNDTFVCYQQVASTNMTNSNVDFINIFHHSQTRTKYWPLTEQ